MAFVCLWTSEEKVHDAQRVYNKKIWQSEPDTKDFARIFLSTTDASRHASLSRLDNDQCDWLGGLPDYIQWRFVKASSIEEAEQNLLTIMKESGFEPKS